MKRKKGKIRGLVNTNAVMNSLKSGASVAAGYVVGQYATKMIVGDGADADKAKSNRGLAGFAKIAIGAILPTVYSNAVTDAMGGGLLVSGFADVLAVNAPDLAAKVGIAGLVETPQQYYPQYFEANTQMREPSMTI